MTNDLLWSASVIRTFTTFFNTSSLQKKISDRSGFKLHIKSAIFINGKNAWDNFAFAISSLQVKFLTEFTADTKRTKFLSQLSGVSTAAFSSDNQNSCDFFHVESLLELRVW